MDALSEDVRSDSAEDRVTLKGASLHAVAEDVRRDSEDDRIALQGAKVSHGAALNFNHEVRHGAALNFNHEVRQDAADERATEREAIRDAKTHDDLVPDAHG